MGSFNTQCSLTGFSIGDYTNKRMVLIPIVQQTGYRKVPIYKQARSRLAYLTGSGRASGAHITYGRSASHSECYSDAWWQPVLLPIHGNYGDCYRLEPDTDELNLKRLEFLVRYIAGEVYCSESDRSPFNSAVPLELFRKGEYDDAMEYIRDGAANGQMFVRNYNGEIVEFQVAAFGESAYNRINVALPWIRDEKLSAEELYYAGHREIVQRNERWKKLDTAPKDYVHVEYNVRSWGTDSGSGLGDNSVFFEYAHENFNAKDLLADPNKYKDQVLPFIKCAMAIAMMNNLFRSFTPLKYTGQESPAVLAKELLDFLTPLKDELVAEHNREFGED